MGPESCSGVKACPTKGAGLSTFERAQFAFLYAQVATRKEKEARIGDSPSLKTSIQEFMLRIANNSTERPQFLSTILIRLESYPMNEANPISLVHVPC